ncbi:MAG TPA: DUF3301 domain-containing protein [Rhodanobacteraceae bacterium]|nr:DUF3301 domain-containing protein [Rhodanobacteraceae bacterium]
MLEVWLPLLICALLGGSWYHVLRLRERAVAHARQLCERRNLQLLDDSVSLHRLHMRWRHGALHVTREYRFHTSSGGNDRQIASITLFGNRVTSASVPGGEQVESPAPVPGSTSGYITSDHGRPTRTEPASDDTDKVIPIVGTTRRTLH